MDSDGPRQFDNVDVSDKDLHDIVISYLAHNCYDETLESLVSASNCMTQPDDSYQTIEFRKRVSKYALEGSALKAIELTRNLAPDFLEKNEDLHFDLLSLHFVELVCSGKCAEALELAQNKLYTFGKEQKHVQKLEDFMALLAYEEPDKSPMFHLVSPEYRQQVADNLNRAILAFSGVPTHVPMERLIQQTAVVREFLNLDSGKDGPPLLF